MGVHLVSSQFKDSKVIRDLVGLLLGNGAAASRFRSLTEGSADMDKVAGQSQCRDLSQVWLLKNILFHTLCTRTFAKVFSANLLFWREANVVPAQTG